MAWKGHKGTFWGSANVLYLHRVWGYTCMHPSKLITVYLRLLHFIIYKFYIEREKL